MKRPIVVLIVFASLLLSARSGLAQGGRSLQTAMEDYVYAYPLVLMDVTRRYVEKIAGSRDVFFRGRVVAHGDPKTQDKGFLVSSAWLVLSKEPVVLHVPDFGGHPFRAQIMDCWTNTFATLGEGDAAIVGPGWTGRLPPGVRVIHSPTDLALILVNIPCTTAIGDIATAYELQDQMRLAIFGSSSSSASFIPKPPAAPERPLKQVADMDGRTFFTYFAHLLGSNPPSEADTGMAERLASLGIVQGFDFDRLDPAVKEDISRSVLLAQASIRSVDANPHSPYLSRARRAINLTLSVSADSAAEQRESDDALSVENDIVFKSKNQNQPNFDIREDIARGRAFLENKTAGLSEVVVIRTAAPPEKKGKRREKLVTERIVRPNFLLAVEDLKERKMQEVRITEKGCVTEGFHVAKTRDNGVASRFEVSYPENMAILALRTTVRSDNGGLKEVVYTPYSQEIDTDLVRKAGLDYLMEQIRQARDDLAARRVKLTQFSDVGDAVLMETSLVLSIIEHIDPERFERSRGNETALIHEVLTIVGANTERAYSYSRSPAGARGLFQFIPSTYRMLQEKYRKAGLTTDFVSGSTDHVNAAKASLLLFETDLGSLPRKWFTGKDGRSIGMYLAAAYNCGAGRVEKSALTCKGQWTCHLPEETRLYLEKFETVWDLLSALNKRVIRFCLDFTNTDITAQPRK